MRSSSICINVIVYTSLLAALLTSCVGKKRPATLMVFYSFYL